MYVFYRINCEIKCPADKSYNKKEKSTKKNNKQKNDKFGINLSMYCKYYIVLYTIHAFNSSTLAIICFCIFFMSHLSLEKYKHCMEKTLLLLRT